jgi:hypothetical protein
LRAKSGAFDAVPTMYHDQGQIAMKLMGFDRGVTLLGGFEFPICTPTEPPTISPERESPESAPSERPCCSQRKWRNVESWREARSRSVESRRLRRRRLGALPLTASETADLLGRSQ